MYLSIIFKLKIYKNTYIQLDIGIRGFQWWRRGESISGYLIVLLVFVNVGIWLFSYNVEANFFGYFLLFIFVVGVLLGYNFLLSKIIDTSII